MKACNRCKVLKDDDHVLPVSKFDLTKKEHVRVCFHWCNLQALCPRDNKRKSNKIIEDLLIKQRNETLAFAKKHYLEHLDIYDFYESNKQYLS